MKTALKVAIGSLLAVGSISNAMADFGGRVSGAATLTYTEASNNGLSIGDIRIVAGNDDQRRAQFLEPEFTADYALELTYRVQNTDTRLFVSYDHFSDDEETLAEQVSHLGFGAAFSSANNARAEHDSQEFRFGARHVLHFGNRFDMQLNGFVDYHKLERDVFEDVRNGALIRQRHIVDEMRGWGPGFGAQGRVQLMANNPCWGLSGGANVSLLYVDNEYVQTFRDETGAFENNGYSHVNPQDSKSVVTKVDTHLALDFTRGVKSDMANFLLSVVLGVKYQNINNALKNTNTGWSSAATGVADSDDSLHVANPVDWGRMGPFLQVRLGGRHA